MKCKTVLLKLSGEALMGPNNYGINTETINYIVDEIKPVVKAGVKLGIVIGGGNIFRGVSGASKGMDRVSADSMGMLATVINALALQSQLENKGIETRVQTSISMTQIAEPYIRRRAMRHLDKGRVVIFAAGTGNPYFTTDTAATLRAKEIVADIVLKATKVDGVYDKDPIKHSDAKKFDSITYLDVLNLGLEIMDKTAISMCMETKMPLVIFNLFGKGNIEKAVLGDQSIGTLVKGD